MLAVKDLMELTAFPDCSPALRGVLTSHSFQFTRALSESMDVFHCSCCRAQLLILWGREHWFTSKELVPGMCGGGLLARSAMPVIQSGAVC